MNTFAVIILVCSSAIAGPDCNTDNARLVVAGPHSSNAAQCGIGGQARMATSGLHIQDGEYVKVLCVRTKRQARK